MTLCRSTLAIALLIGAAAVSSASAQLLPNVSVPNVSGPVGGVLNDVGGNAGRTVGNSVGRTTGGAARQVTRSDVLLAAAPSLQRLMVADWLLDAPPLSLAELRKVRLQQLVAENRATLEMDGAGNPAKRGRLIAIDPSPADLAPAVRAGFTIVADDADKVLGIRSVTLAIPSGTKLAQAADLLRRTSPQMILDYDHIFEPAGGELAASSASLAASTAASANSGPLIGMIDGGVGQSPALSSATIEQRGFSGPAEATGHGTAVASLIVGSDGKFRGVAPGASLLVGDVYGGSPAAGSASAIFKAMSWLASHRPTVINMSIVGPRNHLVERAVSAVQARGIKIVAAVGNDGPAAPPLYPASQPGVIAVTGVDAKNRAIAEAGRSAHLDYAGPGADMAAALPGKGYAAVRGTSFAAPLVSARLALTGSTVRLDAEAAKGQGPVGRGIICASCRVAPKAVGAK